MYYIIISNLYVKYIIINYFFINFNIKYYKNIINY
jgi:hypothetical protein